MTREVYMLAGGRMHKGFEAIIFDVPRGWANQERMYRAIELIKDGVMKEDRYVNDTWKMTRKPCVWVLTNEMPQWNWGSEDRWKIWMLADDRVTLQEVPFVKAWGIFRKQVKLGIHPPGYVEDE